MRSVQVIIFVVSMAVLAVLTYLIHGTRVGKALRAVADDPVTARLLGINTDRLIVLTFFVSSVLGGLAGTLVGLSVSIAGPYFGIAFGLKGLAVIVLGGLGNIPGTMLGGLLIGLAESFVPSQHVAYRDAVPFALLFVILLVRPYGLLGQAGSDTSLTAVAFFTTYGFLIVSMALAALLALSLYIPFLAGQLSLASPGFYALGGYIAAVLATRVLPSAAGSSSVSALLLEMALAAVASGLLAVAVGVPALRLRGIYFALATIAFVEILRVVSLNLEITGGAVGIFGVPQPFASQLGYLWVVAPLLVVTMVVHVAPRAHAGRPGAGGAPGGRAGRRRDGDQSHVLQDACLHDGRDAGRRGRRHQRPLPEHLERPPGDVRRERQPPRLRAHRRLAHLPGTGRGRPRPDRPAGGPPRRGRHRRCSRPGSRASSRKGA